MKVHDLRPSEGATHRVKRVGRGNSSGWGSSAGRGRKGTKARKNVPPGFAGGQMPLQRRLPKWGGFASRNRVEYSIVTLSKLETSFEPGSAVGPNELGGGKQPFKVLATGELSKALTIQVHACSGAARTKIEAAGGSVEIVGK